LEIRLNEPLTPYTTYQIGGECAIMLFPQSREDFLKLPELIEDKPCLWMGGGANILFGDGYFDAVIVNMTQWNGIDYNQDTGVAHIRAGTQLPEFVSWVRENGIADFDYLAGIPGTVGGAVFMNAGAWRRYIEGQILGSELYDLNENKFVQLSREDMIFEYRRQKFLGRGQIVISAELDVSRFDPEIGSKIDDIIAQRCGKHPTEPSCGSVFKNPPDTPAGRLIESCGLKGRQLGNAQISEKHANFIINLGGARFADINGLIELAQDRVHNQFGVMLDPEVRIIADTSHELFFRLT